MEALSAFSGGIFHISVTVSCIFKRLLRFHSFGFVFV